MGKGGLCLLFMLSVGYIDRLHQSPALEGASGGGREGLTAGLQERMGDGEKGRSGGKRLKRIRGVSIETGEKGANS